jgi:integrase
MPARKRKTWMGRVFFGRDEHGKQQYWWVGRFATRRERDDAVAAARLERPWENGLGPDGVTCDEWADRMLARMESGALRTRGGRKFKDSSIDTARSQLKACRAEFGPRTPRSITRTEAEDWAATVQPSALPIVVRLMNDLVRAEEIDRNRFQGLTSRPVDSRDRRPPSQEEMVLLLDGCDALGATYAPFMRALFTFGTYTLMRPGELIALDWSNIDLDAGAHGRVTVATATTAARPTCPSPTGSAPSRSRHRPATSSTSCSRSPATTRTGSCSATRPAAG